MPFHGIESKRLRDEWLKIYHRKEETMDRWVEFEKGGSVKYGRVIDKNVLIISKSANCINMTPKVYSGLFGDTDFSYCKIFTNGGREFAIGRCDEDARNSYKVENPAGRNNGSIGVLSASKFLKKHKDDMVLMPYRLLYGHFQNGMFVVDTNQDLEFL